MIITLQLIKMIITIIIIITKRRRGAIMVNERKLIKIGKSYGVTLPVDMLKEQGIEYGDMLDVKSDNGAITISKARKVTLPDGISSDFFDILEETAQEHGEALKKLADK